MSIWSTFTSLSTGGMSTVYKWAAIAGVILALCVGSYAYGVHTGDLKSKATIAAFIAKRDQQAIDLLGVNTVTANRIVIQTVHDVQVIHDVQTKIQTVIQHDVPDTSILSLGWLRAYNLSATGELPSAASGTNDATPTIKATDALSGIADNNATCLLYKQRAEAVIQFEAEVQKNIAQANKK